MKKVFIISQWGWAPKMNAQILRLVNLTKHLPEHGWEAVVFSRKARKGDFIDKNFTGGKEKVYEYRGILPHIHRLNVILRDMFITDVFMIDLLIQIKHMERIIEKEKPDVILASTPPSGLLAAYILSTKTGIPLVLDYADPWTTSKVFRPLTGMHRNFNEKLEREAISRASAISVASPIHISELREKFGNGEKYEWIPNGYDEKMFLMAKKANNHEKTIFMYGGSIYNDFDLSFLDIFREVHAMNDNFILRFVGRTGPKTEYIKKKGKGFVELTGPVSREEYASHLISSDFLVFGRGEKYDNFMSSRSLELARSMKPIIAFVKKESLIGEIFSKSGSAFIFEKGDEKVAKEFIIKAIEGEIKVRPDMEYISQFEWDSLSGKLANMLDGARHE